MRKTFIAKGAQVENKFVDDAHKYERYIIKSVDENGDGVAYGIVNVDQNGKLILSEDSVKITEKNAIRYRYLKNDEARPTPEMSKTTIVDGVIMYNGSPASEMGQGNIVAISILGTLPGVVVFVGRSENDHKKVYIFDIERDIFEKIVDISYEGEVGNVEVVNADAFSLVFICKTRRLYGVKKDDGTIEKTLNEFLDARCVALTAKDGRHVIRSEKRLLGYPVAVKLFGKNIAIEYRKTYTYEDKYRSTDSFINSHTIIAEGDENRETLILQVSSLDNIITLPVADIEYFARANENRCTTYSANGEIYVQYLNNPTIKLPKGVSSNLCGFTAIDFARKDEELYIFFVKDEDIKTVVRTTTIDRGELYKII